MSKTTWIILFLLLASAIATGFYRYYHRGDLTVVYEE